MHFNKKNNNRYIITAAATIFTLAIIMTSSIMVTPAAATITPSPVTARTDNESASQPVYQTQEKLVSQSPINQTHAEFVVSANGTLTLPNATETIRTTSTKSGIVSMMDGTFAGKEVLTTEDRSEFPKLLFLQKYSTLFCFYHSL